MADVRAVYRPGEPKPELFTEVAEWSEDELSVLFIRMLMLLPAYWRSAKAWLQRRLLSTGSTAIRVTRSSRRRQGWSIACSSRRMSCSTPSCTSGRSEGAGMALLPAVASTWRPIEAADLISGRRLDRDENPAIMGESGKFRESLVPRKQWERIRSTRKADSAGLAQHPVRNEGERQGCSSCHISEKAQIGRLKGLILALPRLVEI